MRIHLRTNDLLLNTNERSTIVGFVHDALARYAGRIGRVNVYARDINGPRNGIGHSCRISVHLPAADSVVVAGSAEELLPLVKRTAERAAFAVRRNTNRRRTVKRRRAVTAE